MSAESLDGLNEKPTGNSDDHLLYGNVLHADPLGVSNRRIERLSDDIASAQMFGGDTAAKEHELQGEIDMRDYLMSRDYKDQYNNIHDAENNRFKSLDNANRKEEDLGRTYESMTINELIDKWAESEDNNDRTSSSNVQDELQERLLKIPTIAEDNTDRDNHGVTENHKMQFIDVMHREMMSRRKNIDSNEVNDEQTNHESSTEPLDEEIDTTTPGAEGHRNELYENETNESEPEVDSIIESEPVAPVIPAEQPAPTSPVNADEELKSPLKLVLNVDDSRSKYQMAEDMAEARLQRELENGGKIKHFIDKIWKSGMAKDHYIRKYRVEARRYIEEHGGNNDDPNVPADVRAQAKESLVWQFQQDCEEFIHTDNGEKKSVLEPTHELAIGAKELVRAYCRGEFRDDAALAEARTRLINDYREAHPNEDIGVGIATVDNLLEISKAVSGMVEHGESIDNVIDNIQIIMGEARSGLRTEAKFNKVDEAIDKLARTKIGSLVMPLAIVSAASIAASLLRVGGRAGVKKGASFALGAAGGLAVGAALSGTLAGIQENKRMKEDRANHMRDMAVGKEYNEGDKRRSELQDTVYEMASAKEITDEINGLASNERLAAGGKEAIDLAIDALVKIELRNQYSDSKKIDLIKFSNPESVVIERLQLDKARAGAKAAISGQLTDEMRHELGIGAEGINQIIESRSGAYQEVLDTDISTKDALFKKIKNRHVAKAAAIGVATSLTFGLVAQEIGAALDPTRAGLLEQAWHAENVPVNGELHKTLLGGIFSAEHASAHTGPGAGLNSESFAGGKDLLEVSNDSDIVNNGNGTFDIIDHNGGVSADNIPINSDGSLPQSSIDQLHNLNMVVSDKSINTTVLTSHTDYVDAKEFINHNIGETTAVHRELWYDNNTSGVYDKNELGLWWGGDNNNGITDDGYQFNASNITEAGSFHDGQSVNWEEAANKGNLVLTVTASSGTESQAFVINVDHNGVFNIPKDSPAGQLFSVENGKAVFHGAHVEVSEVRGINANGATDIRPLATYSGHHDLGLQPIETTAESIVHTPIYEIITPGYDTVLPDYIEMPPVIPVVPRENLGSAKSKYETVDYGYGYRGYRELGERKVEERRKETSPRLRDNPDADLVPAEEFAFYKDLLVEKRGQEYVNEINDIVSKTPELNNLNSETKMIVMIPINASGKSESENIYDVLTVGYGSQDSAGLKSTEILLHVNWFDSYDEDESIMRANISKTKSEIQRAKDDLADQGVNVAVIETEYKRSEVNGGVIGYVARKMNDVALLALASAASAGRIDRNHDVLLIRNDADAIGIRRHYLKRYKDEFDSSRETDIFMGTTSFDQTKADRVPGFVFSGNFMQSFDIIANSREGRVHTGGANFGVRASTLAAVGGLGFDDYTGAGSDDVEIGRRVNYGRNNKLSTGDSSADTYVSDYQKDQSDQITRSKRVVGKAVHGARIDTDSDRGEEMYIDGEGIINQWSKKKTGKSFSDNGYKPRNEGLVGNYSESLKRSPDEVVESVRRDFEATIRGMGSSSSVIRTALAFALPSSSYYELTNSDSKYNFKITPEGAKYLKKRLIPYGRKKRQWYGDNGARKSTMIKI